MKRDARTSAISSKSLPTQPAAEREAIPLSEIRDEAWKCGIAEPRIPFTPDAIEAIFSKASAADREQFLDLACRPIAQRERIRKHWSGDVDNIEATRALFSHVLSGELMNAVAFVREPIEQTQWYGFMETAIDFAKDLIAQMEPRDPLELMLVQQALWLHARLARLTVQAARATGEKSVRALNEAADRTANAYRRHMLALGEYRAARRPRVFMPIKSAQIANAAGQQVVNACGTPRRTFFRTLKNLRTKRNRNAIDGQAVPAITPGTTGEAGEHPQGKTVAPDTRADHG